MKTLVYITLCCIAFLPVTAQLKVGANPTSINTGAVLQVDANGSRGAFQLPRVTLTGTADVTTVASPQAGFTVYNTATAGIAPNNVTPGYYYYDGTQWIKLMGSTTGTDKNIYDGDGTLAGNRIVTQGANTLAFTTTVQNGFSVDGSTFSVHGGNHFVGIGTTAPGYNLDVNGTARIASLPDYSIGGGDAFLVTDWTGQLKKANLSLGGCPVCILHEDPGTHEIPYGTTYYYDANGNYTGVLVLPPAGRFPGDMFTFQHSAQNGTTILTTHTNMTSNLGIYSPFTGGASFVWSGNTWMLTSSSGTGGGGNWTTTGNWGMTAGTNFIGTIDNVDVVFKRAGVQSGLLGGTNNTSWGVNALNPASTGANNTALGAAALSMNTTGGSNTAIGSTALSANTIGAGNVAIGLQTMAGNTTGSNNTATGNQSLVTNTTGTNNTATGLQSLYSNSIGGFNTANGVQSLVTNTTGNNNTANGYTSLYANTTGGNNTANGAAGLYNNTTGDFNTASGVQSLFANTTGTGNVAHGYQSLVASSTGNNNTAIGNAAGSNVTTGSNNITIGANANLVSGATSNQLNIGNAIFGTGLNGNVAAPAGNIGIGTSAPQAVLDINNNGSSANAVLKLRTPFSGATTDSLLTWNPADSSVRKIKAIEPWYNQATNTGATANTQNIYQLGNVGIGTAPSQRLDVLAGDEGPNYVSQAGAGAMTIMRLERLGAFGQSYNPIMDIKIGKQGAGQAPNSNSRTVTTFTLAGETSQVANVDVLTLQAALNQARVGVGVGAPQATLDISNAGSTTLPALKITTPFSGAATDSLLTWNPADNTVRKLSTAQISNISVKPIATQTTDYNFTATDYTILMDCTAGPLTVTLPVAASNAGKIIVVSKADETSNTLTFSPALRKSVSTTIASNNTQVTYTLQSDGADWWIIGKFW